MNSLPIFLKQLRKASSLTQIELANALGVSTVLISMLESGQKKASLKFLHILARKLKVHPGAIAPLAFNDHASANQSETSQLEKKLINLGIKLQEELIKKKAKYLKIDG
ncbi:MAG: helix-turn-helix transcriptional regulator [Candidatus Pacebacteria bacterium]|nr:helix-turn-helix transcriptional regulator [Candidatus Paceibacterota bacterium]